MKNKHKVLFTLALAATMMSGAEVQSCRLTFSGSAGAETLKDFPALIKIPDGLTGFNYADSSTDGSDLAFFGADGQQLAYEIDTWDPEGDSYVWVRVPEVTKSTTITARWGNPGGHETTSVQQQGVWSEDGPRVVSQVDGGRFQGMAQTRLRLGDLRLRRTVRFRRFRPPRRRVHRNRRTQDRQEDARASAPEMNGVWTSPVPKAFCRSLAWIYGIIPAMKKSLLLLFTVPAAVAGAEYDFVSAPEAPFKMPDVPVWRVPASEFPITDYGAVTGAVKNTETFAKAIAACSAAGGGRVVVPEGDWRTGAIHLKSNVALDLREGSRIVFTDDPADYLQAVHTNWEGVEAMSYSPLIFAYCCTNIAIIGKGRIAPETKLWRKTWDNRNTPMHKAFIATLYDWCSMGVPLEKRDITRFPGSHARPHLIQINRSANILLEDFLIRGSPFWNIHLFHSENVVVRRVDIYSHGHNTDGIDIDMTKNVIVENCIFDQGDDAVILKAARNHDAWRLGRSTENVVVRHCTVRNGHVLMGAGSDVSGGIRNVLMHDCQMVGNVNNVFFVKTNERRGGFVENIYMKDCSVEMRGKSVPTSVVGIETDVLYEWRNLPTWEVRVTRIRNICAENVRAARARHLLMVHGDARDPVDGVTLRNVTCGETTQEEVVVVNAKNVTMDGKPIPSLPGKAPAY